MTEKKMCPLLAASANRPEIAVLAGSMAANEQDARGNRNTDCKKEKCEWWTEVYTSEGSAQQGCSIKFIPMMNSDGQYWEQP